ncbi:DNA damage checkpoint control protein rad1 [Curvularia clavata]|uniref:DNA damage checkpoint control protein rad1 n=1 Tax=Curvularia clavata TaxID=95742 RepID=A0A9Q8ZBT2_CURCL|nr:DNA damage checkpoint control protein rad1 [Curvularia clavata]
MSSPLLDVWEAAASQPFYPTVGKDTQFTVGFVLLAMSLVMTTIFGLNRSLVNLPVLGVPASLAFGFGAVYMICARLPRYGEMDDQETPVLTAVSSSARQLYQLLRCIAFSNKAHVQISDIGLKLAVDEASVMEASAFLDKSLFTTYTFDDHDDASTTESAFQISLPALLETLQIFGLTDPAASKPPWARDAPYPTSTAFTGNNIMGGMNNLCRISYQGPGFPLAVTLMEMSIRTQCDLTTYKPECGDEIPFDRDALVLKVIMRGSWLYDAIQELSSTSPEKLTMYAKTVRGEPFFALSSSGTLGSARVEFNNQPQPSAYRTPASTNVNPSTDAANQQSQANLLERFQLSDPDTIFRSSYKFSLIQKAARAMSVATKVSIRADIQGVLSLQFMIEVEGPGAGLGAGGAPASGKNGFVDFRFVPLVDEDDDDEVEAGHIDETIMHNASVGDESE